MSKKEKDTRLGYGYELILIQSIALSGISHIIEEKESEIEEVFGSDFIQSAKYLSKQAISLEDLEDLLSSYKNTHMYNLGYAGINRLLWQVHEENNIGILVNIDDIPISREVIEITDFYSINPYELSSEGAYLIASLDLRGVLRKLEEAGLNARRIGNTMKENRVIIRGEGVRRTLKPPKKDSLERE